MARPSEPIRSFGPQLIHYWITRQYDETGGKHVRCYRTTISMVFGKIASDCRHGIDKDLCRYALEELLKALSCWLAVNYIDVKITCWVRCSTNNATGSHNTRDVEPTQDETDGLSQRHVEALR